jgi:glutaredoxin-like protein
VIPLRDQEYIQQLFAQELEGRVKIDYLTQRASRLIVSGREECATCEDTGKLLAELAALSEKITLTVYELNEAPDEAKKLKIDRVPGIVIRGPANRALRFFGAPAGNEFPNFVETVVAASKQKVELGEESAKQLKKLKDKVSIAVYVTPTCPYCPQMVRSAYRLALASAHVEATAVEINEFPRLAQQLGVRSVPLTVLNGEKVIAGAMDEATLVEAVLRVAEGRAADAPGGDEATSVELQEPQQAPAPRTGPSGLILPR